MHENTWSLCRVHQHKAMYSIKIMQQGVTSCSSVNWLLYSFNPFIMSVLLFHKFIIGIQVIINIMEICSNIFFDHNAIFLQALYRRNLSLSEIKGTQAFKMLIILTYNHPLGTNEFFYHSVRFQWFLLFKTKLLSHTLTPKLNLT